MSDTSRLADERHRSHMRRLLTDAADRFRLTLDGTPVFGWRDRSIGARAHGTQGKYWVRVVTEHHRWAMGDFWTGNADSRAVAGVPKPEVIDMEEWDDASDRVRAELMNLMPGHVCSTTSEIHEAPPVSASWWEELRTSLGRVAVTSTERVAVGQESVTRRLSVFFGDAVDPTVREWSTAHADLHWNNLLAPELGMVDWEGWGRAPVGLDAATLYCHSLLVPDTAACVRAAFGDQLASPDGVRSQLYVIARLLLRIERGDDPGLAVPLHRLAASLLDR